MQSQLVVEVRENSRQDAVASTTPLFYSKGLFADDDWIADEMVFELAMALALALGICICIGIGIGVCIGVCIGIGFGICIGVCIEMTFTFATNRLQFSFGLSCCAIHIIRRP